MVNSYLNIEKYIPSFITNPRRDAWGFVVGKLR